MTPMPLDASSPISVERISGRTGLSADAVAILMILGGVLVIWKPELLSYVVGIVLITLGVLWLVTSFRARRTTPAP